MAPNATASGNVEHCLRQDHDQHHMDENADVDEADLPRPELAARAQRHGGDEVAQHAERQRDLERQQGGEAAVERMGQGIPVVSGHGNSGGIKDQDDERHDAPRAPADGAFHRPHRLAPDRLADGLEDRHLEKHRADEEDRGKQMQGDEDQISHDCFRLLPRRARSAAR